MTHQTTNPYYCVCVCDNINESRTSIFVTRLYICPRPGPPRGRRGGRGKYALRRIRIPPPPPTLSLAPCTMKRKPRNENLCGAQSRDRERVRLSALASVAYFRKPRRPCRWRPWRWLRRLTRRLAEVAHETVLALFGAAGERLAVRLAAWLAAWLAQVDEGEGVRRG